MNDNRPVPWPWAESIKEKIITETIEGNELLWPRPVSRRRVLGRDLIGNTCQIYRIGDPLIQNIVEGRITICLDEDGKVIDVFEEATLDEK